MEKVVVTGIGCVTPFGFGVNTLWESLLSGRNGIKKVTHLNLSGEIVNIAGSMPLLDQTEAGLGVKEDTFFPEDGSILSFFSAVEEAVKDAGLDLSKYYDKDRVGCFIADRKMGEINYLEQYGKVIRQSKDDQGRVDKNKFYSNLENTDLVNWSEISDFDTLNHFVSRYYGITGPQLSLSTACASSNSSIGEAFLKIRSGALDLVICGGAYNFDLNAMAGFSRLGALSKNPDPESACRPFDAHRNGFIMGSGCGILILENAESARKREARIHCEIKGYGCYSDAYRSTDPDPEALGVSKAIQKALQLAGLGVDDIQYINAHGTSTKMNDYSETVGIKNIFKKYAYEIPVSSTKSMIGHSIMAAGALEGIVCIKSINENIIHGTHNWTERDELLDLDYVKETSRRLTVKNALSNSFGFGGVNSCIIYAKVSK